MSLYLCCIIFWIVMSCACVTTAEKHLENSVLVQDKILKELFEQSGKEIFYSLKDRLPKRLIRRSLRNIRTHRDVKTLVDALKANTEMLENVTNGVNNLVKWSRTEHSGYTDIKERLENLNPAFVSLFVMLADVALSTSPRFASHQGDLLNISRYFRGEISTKRDNAMFDDNMFSVLNWYANPDVLNLTSCVDVKKSDDHRKAGSIRNGIYNIKIPNTDKVLNVWCDQETDGGGWLVIQRRQDGSEDFFRSWADYERGFGDVKGEFWLGNENLHYLTRTKQELRVDIMDFDGNTAYAKYSSFAIGSLSEFYKLSVSGYSGNAGDGMKYGDGVRFYAADSGSRDVNNHKGPWWHKGCCNAQLNGVYYKTSRFDSKGVSWYYWKNSYMTLKRADMKIRPAE